MKKHYESLAADWKKTALQFHAAGYHHMAALFEKYYQDNLEKAAQYED